MGATLNVIDYWLKLFHKNYEVRWNMYNKAMIVFQKNTNNEIKTT